MYNSIPKEDLEDFIQRFSEILPEYFRLHSRLIAVADPETHEIDCSLNKLAGSINYDCRLLYFWLTGLVAMRFVAAPCLTDFDKNIRIKVLVNY